MYYTQVIISTLQKDAIFSKDDETEGSQEMDKGTDRERGGDT